MTWEKLVADNAAWRKRVGPGYSPHQVPTWDRRIRGTLGGTSDLFTETIADEHGRYVRFWEDR